MGEEKFFCLRPNTLSVGPSFQLTDSTSRRFVHKRVVGLAQDGSRVLISQDRGLRDCFSGSWRGLCGAGSQCAADDASKVGCEVFAWLMFACARAVRRG